MKSYDEMDFHPDSEELVKILCARTRNTNPLFFRVTVAYYFSLIASMMRCDINTLDRGPIPVNMYAINLMTSGAGKGMSTNIIEDQVINQFSHNFTDVTFPLLAQKNLPKLANKRATRHSLDPDEELQRTVKEFELLGPLVMMFDSATSPAVKQARDKLLMADAGSLNLQMDEVGSNLSGSAEAFTTMLELYDVGKVKQKLIKSTKENVRVEEIKGRTPANMLLFGTPGALLDGGKTEEEFYNMLDTGYARRCVYGYSRTHDKMKGLTPEEIFDMNTDKSVNAFIEKLSDRLGDLADIAFVNKQLDISRDVTLLFIEYQIACETKADALADHDEMRRAEMTHRYFKALKLAGVYAFIDSSPEVTEDHAYYAIKLVEQSGKAFDQILTRDRAYVKLAKYLADVKRSVTQADLIEDLPFYKGSAQQKQEILGLAIAYGYQHNIVIKKSYTDGIEFLRGETLEKTDLDNMQVSYSEDFAYHYVSDTAKFEDLHLMTQIDGIHWCSHGFEDGHRTEDTAQPGFNMVVLDVDHGINIQTAMMMLKDYKALFYTTKRHTDTEHRFRIILPTTYKLDLDAKDYKEFMANIGQWLPFEVDTATGQRSRKWLSHNGEYHYQDGELLDVLPFIPKTSKNDSFKERVLDQQGMDSLERWVMNNTGDGNRNNMLLRFAMILLDAGFDFDGIMSRVSTLNSKLPDKLTEVEIMATVMTTVGKKISQR